jgi:hypothetical protein
MIVLAIRFNNSGMSTDLGSMGDYANVAFYFLISASIVAFMSACCGLLTCKCTNRCIAVIFGCTLLPAALIIVVFGFLLTGISGTDEAKLNEFCVKDLEAFKETTAKDEWTKQLRETIDEVDYQVGSTVSSLMCSAVCPCNVEDVPSTEGNDVKKEWAEVLTNQEMLTKYDRCLEPGVGGCTEEKALYMFDGDNDFVKQIMEEFGITAYKTFKDCYNDLREGKRSTDQITEEQAKEY